MRVKFFINTDSKEITFYFSKQQLTNLVKESLKIKKDTKSLSENIAFVLSSVVEGIGEKEKIKNIFEYKPIIEVLKERGGLKNGN